MRRLTLTATALAALALAAPALAGWPPYRPPPGGDQLLGVRPDKPKPAAGCFVRQDGSLPKALATPKIRAEFRADRQALVRLVQRRTGRHGPCRVQHSARAAYQNYYVNTVAGLSEACFIIPGLSGQQPNGPGTNWYLVGGVDIYCNNNTSLLGADVSMLLSGVNERTVWPYHTTHLSDFSSVWVAPGWRVVQVFTEFQGIAHWRGPNPPCTWFDASGQMDCGRWEDGVTLPWAAG